MRRVGKKLVKPIPGQDHLPVQRRRDPLLNELLEVVDQLPFLERLGIGQPDIGIGRRVVAAGRDDQAAGLERGAMAEFG
jgi:hypothetical protein